jgi:hypothetical protein
MDQHLDRQGPDRETVERLAWKLEAYGTVPFERELQRLATAARRAGVRPIAAAVLADSTASEVARLRAFGLVAGALATLTPPPDTVLTAA